MEEGSLSDGFIPSGLDVESLKIIKNTIGI